MPTETDAIVAELLVFSMELFGFDNLFGLEIGSKFPSSACAGGAGVPCLDTVAAAAAVVDIVVAFAGNDADTSSIVVELNSGVFVAVCRRNIG